MHEIDLREISECAHLKFTVYGRKQASIHTHAQCSDTSVGLAQARPNYVLAIESVTFQSILLPWEQVGDLETMQNCV